MKLDALTRLLQQDPLYQKTLQRIRRAGDAAAGQAETSPLSIELLEAARPFLIASLQRDWSGPLLIVSGTPAQARFLAEQVGAWSAAPDKVRYFHAPDALFYDRGSWERDTIHARIGILSLLDNLRADQAENRGQGSVVTTAIWALMAKSVPPMAFRRATRTLQVGDTVGLYPFLKYCVDAGYEPAVVVEEPGTFGHRGSIIDIYPHNMAKPLRIDFFGDEIDSMRIFDPATQRSVQPINRAALSPASEALPEWGKAAAEALRAIDLSGCDSATRQRMAEEREQIIKGVYIDGIEYYLPYLYPRPSTLLAFLPENTLILLDDLLTLETAAIGLENQALSLRAEMIQDGQLPSNYAVPYLPWEDLKKRLTTRRAVNLGYGLQDTPLGYGRAFMAAPRYGGQLGQALRDIAELRSKGQRIVLITRQAERLADLLREQDMYATPITEVRDMPEEGDLCLVDGILAEGWAYQPAQLVVLTDAEVFGWVRARRRRPPRRRHAAPESLFADLKAGDNVVHLEYGIGRYHGMVRKTIGGLEREYLEIEYAAGDRLYVPIHQADRVSRYVGADGREAYLHRLGGRGWAAIRAKAEKAVRDIAESLLEMYAAREVTPGYAFGPDTAWQDELEASFPYEETDDQIRALAEIKDDMEKPKPMDRLICGDVGYGKTEVALRAAFKAVMAGKQVAMLVPTTILAQQHFHTFRRRLRAFPVVVEMLSRFRSQREQEEVLDSLLTGRVDIVVGTHRLFSKDVSFRDLGLLIVDEEQRFGVLHKERLKQLRREVDVLTLTATPIPRTLYMAMSGIRDMSVIDTPPENRLAVRTYVAEHDEALIRKAILREMDRGGQVYYVHNRVQDIDNVAADLQRIVPEASLAIGHGQMDENELAQVMLGFAQGEFTILLCTTIIESGLDIPNVNTIIMDRADRFGLAQLYQLRGRVGRGVNRAYAYLLYKPPLTEVAQKRLQTIQEASELGAGFRVAMRDMEIRGAGDILGAEQHGHIAAIGFDLYCRLLQRAVQELGESSGESMHAIRRAQNKTAGRALGLDLGPSIDLPISAYLSDEFIPDTQLRLRLYRRLARIESLEEIEALSQELADRFGKLPEPVSGLLYLLRVRVVAAEAGVPAVKGNRSRIAIVLPTRLTAASAALIHSRYRDAEARGTRVWLTPVDGWQDKLLELLQTLGEMTTAGRR